MLCETSLVCPPAFDSLGRLRFLRLELRDDGCGFDPAKRYDGFGLLGIKERVESMGGELTVQSAPENGTAILVFLPLMKYPLLQV